MQQIVSTDGWRCGHEPWSQPRLVTDGAVKGGRYVSDVVDLVVSQGQTLGWARARHR